MLAILLLHLIIEIKYLTAKGWKPSGTLQRKPTKVHSKFITLYNSSTWTALLAPAQCCKWALHWTPLQSPWFPQTWCPSPISPTTLVHCCHCVVCQQLKGTHRKPSLSISESLGPTIPWVLISQAPIWLALSSSSSDITRKNQGFAVLHIKSNKLSWKPTFIPSPPRKN